MQGSAMGCHPLDAVHGHAVRAWQIERSYVRTDETVEGVGQSQPERTSVLFDGSRSDECLTRRLLDRTPGSSNPRPSSFARCDVQSHAELQVIQDQA